jgi:hypothetical protein
MNRCAARGCGRFARAGARYCGRHDPHASFGQTADAEVPSGEEANGHAAFRARLATGDYEEVIGAALRRVLQGAAASPALDAEVGALRVALARLIREERDPSRLAAGVARVADVALRAAKLRGGEGDQHAYAAILAKTLEEIEREGLIVVSRPPEGQASHGDESPAAGSDLTGGGRVLAACTLTPPPSGYPARRPEGTRPVEPGEGVTS